MFKCTSKVAILLATYNGGKFLREQLESLENQTFKDFTCYIHDDGSVDDTLKVAYEFCTKDPDRFIVLDYPQTGGAKMNFFSLMKQVEADYYMFCDQDDIWLPSKIQESYEAAEKNNEGKGIVVFTDLKVGEDIDHIRSDSFYRVNHTDIANIDYRNSLIEGYVPGCVMLVDKILMQKANIYKNIDNIKMHDWWIIALAKLTDSAFVFIDKPLIMYRQHHDNTIGAKDNSRAARISFNLKRIFNGTIRKAKKENLESRRIQAEELYDTGFGDSSKRTFIKQYIDITNRNKFARMGFYNRSFKNVYRLWWMILWV